MSSTFPVPEPGRNVGSLEVASFVARRGITEVLHFTTAPSGMVGICATGAVQSRDRLDEDEYVANIYRPNCHDRLKDADWTDYVSLSISRVNKRMLGSSVNWHSHEGVWWVVLSFDAVILGHPGLYFTTTNNTYSGTVRRAAGIEGLKDMFSDRVPWGYYGYVATRSSGTPTYWTTEPQAEVLYPGQLSLDYLRAIYVAEAEHIDEVKTWLEMFPAVPNVPVTEQPEVFS